MIKSFDIYKTPLLYDDQYWWKKDDIEFYRSLFEPKSNVLELGSGTGRLGFPLIRSDIIYYGLELSQEFCTYTRNKLISDSHKRQIIHGDMRDFTFNIKFDYIFIGFNTLLHILTNSDAKKCFNRIYNHLKDEGRFVFDIVNPHPDFLYKDSTKEYEVMEFKDTSLNDNVTVYETSSYNSISEICSIEWRYAYCKEQSNDRKFNYQMRMYYPDTINRLLVESNFQICSIFGGYEKQKFKDSSQLQIYICKKHA